MSAFSEHQPNVQLAWDASSLKSFQKCPRHYYYANLQGWQNPSVDLAFGRLVASGLERYQKIRLDGKSREDAILGVVRWALEETWTDDTHQWGGHYENMWKCEGTEKYKNEKGNKAVCPYAFKAVWFPGAAPDVCGTCGSGIRQERQYVADDAKKNRHSLIRTLIWYGLDQPEELDDGLRPYVFADGTKAVELSGRMPLPYRTAMGEQYLLTWNFDYLAQFGDEVFVADNKTTGKSLDEKYFDTWSPDTQFDTYAMVGSIAFPAVNIQGTVVDAIQLLANDVDFGRRFYYKNDEQHEEHLYDLKWWLDSAEHSAVTGYWPMNKNACWLCPFKKVCSQPPSLRDGYLKQNFQKQPRWDPTAER